MKENLTDRQQKIFEMLLDGIPPKEIAYNLHISYNTLLFHQKQLYRKLDVHSFHELIAKYAPKPQPSPANQTFTDEGSPLAAQSEAAIMIAPESGVTEQESLTAGWLDIRFGEVGVRRKTLSAMAVILGILAFAAVLLFVLFMRKPTDKGFSAVFNQWSPFDSVEGSINILVNPNDVIEGKHFASYTMSGILPEGRFWNGMSLQPVPLTLYAMRGMTSFSFKVLGDGKDYRINITTTDTNTEYDVDHYCIMFPTTNGQISTVTINVDDLMQSGFGIQVPFVPNNILRLEFYIVKDSPYPEPFYLKIWDIRIF